MKMNATTLSRPDGISAQTPGLGDTGADDASDQRVRRGRRNAVVPGDQVPGDRADECAEHHVVIDDTLLDDSLADRCRHIQMKDEQRDEIEDRREQPPPGTASARRVETTVAIEFAASWKPVHEIERQRDSRPA
jgi:hypothetical protein